MTSPDQARWRRTKQIFTAAVERSGEAREAFVAEACGGDPELLANVRALLRADDSRGGPLERVASAIDAGLGDGVGSGADHERWLGRVVGGFRLEALLGTGGMSMVFRGVPADAAAGLGPVAIKLLAPGMEVRRFETEREVLARVDHSGIAVLRDWGQTDEGIPYYVMDLVEGQPIDVHADRERLSVRSRVELVIAVCAAVSHAHERQVLHRDLKPSNVLVRPNGEPVLLDFGVAKLVGPTLVGEPATLSRESRAFSLYYASPEHMAGEAVSARSDVYSIGVLLYRLLAGAPPPAGDGPRLPLVAVLDRCLQELPETVHLRQTTVPELRRAFRGLLGDIAAKACAFEPAERYGSVRALARELERFLGGSLLLQARWAWRRWTGAIGAPAHDTAAGARQDR